MTTIHQFLIKSEVIHAASFNADGDETNVYDLDYYRARVKYIDGYKPSRPVGRKSLSSAGGKLKTDRERVKEEQLRNGNYKDLKK